MTVRAIAKELQSTVWDTCKRYKQFGKAFEEARVGRPNQYYTVHALSSSSFEELKADSTSSKEVLKEHQQPQLKGG